MKHLRQHPARPRLCIAAFLMLVFVAVTVTPVHAYLDPGTGSFVLQMILGGVAGVALLVRIYWQKFLDLFRAKTNDAGNSGERAHGETD